MIDMYFFIELNEFFFNANRSVYRQRDYIIRRLEQGVHIPYKSSLLVCNGENKKHGNAKVSIQFGKKVSIFPLNQKV